MVLGDGRSVVGRLGPAYEQLIRRLGDDGGRRRRVWRVGTARQLDWIGPDARAHLVDGAQLERIGATGQQVADDAVELGALVGGLELARVAVVTGAS